MADKRAIKVSTLDRLAEGFQESRGITDKLTTEQMIAFAKEPVGGGENKFAQYADGTLTEITEADLNGATSIRSAAFQQCSSLTRVTISGSVKSIGDRAFSNCSNITDMTLCEGVQSIGNYVFLNCNGLKRITIPKSVTVIGNETFPPYLANVYYGGDISSWCNYDFSSRLESCPFYRNGAKFYIKNSLGEYELVTNLIIPDTVTQIKQNAFAGCTCLKSITIPNSVASIGHNAFYKCSGVTTVRIGNGIQEISQYAVFDNSVTDIYIDKAEGEVANAPWGATNATIHYNTPLPSEEA